MHTLEKLANRLENYRHAIEKLKALREQGVNVPESLLDRLRTNANECSLTLGKRVASHAEN